ncbi:MAG: DNA cytosine methyltransferase [Clostridium beijerinckii]|nr:DNA cytosine methyltransferase [Clostridium beijerinckii]
MINVEEKMCKYKLIDLFAGAGGLSYGFLQTEKFEVKLAVEINENAQKTYKENHKNDEIEIKSNIHDVNFSEIKDRYGDIDFVIGGPPCQGFSNANRQRNTLISNNNKLVKEYIRAIECLKPKGFILENVKTMKSSKHKFYLSNSDLNDNLIAEKLQVQADKIGIARNNKLVDECFDSIVNILDLNNDFTKYKLNDKLLSILRTLIKKDKSKIDIKALQKECGSTLKEWLSKHSSYLCDEYQQAFINLRNSILDKNLDFMLKHIIEIVEIQRIVYKLVEVQNNDIIIDEVLKEDNTIYLWLRSYNIFEYVKAKLSSLGYELNDFILDASNYGVPQFRNRLIVIGIKKEYLKEKEITKPEMILANEEYFTIKDAISDLEQYDNYFKVEDDYGVKRKKYNKLSKLQTYLCDSDKIKNLIITETREDAMKRFEVLKQGENFHDLEDELKESYANPERTQSSIYKRLEYKKPSGTVTNVRKAMWVHPIFNRAISVREAARLQSFPDSFVFYGKKDSQYQQIGNAVPPMLSRAIAEKVLELIGDKPKEYLKDKIK